MKQKILTLFTKYVFPVILGIAIIGLALFVVGLIFKIAIPVVRAAILLVLIAVIIICVRKLYKYLKIK